MDQKSLLSFFCRKMHGNQSPGKLARQARKGVGKGDGSERRIRLEVWVFGGRIHTSFRALIEFYRRTNQAWHAAQGEGKEAEFSPQMKRDLEEAGIG